MSDRATFQLLKTLANSEGFKKLMGLWMLEVSEIESRRDSAAQRSQESAWRYFAGQEKGYKKAMVRLAEELSKMEEEGGDFANEPSEKIERLLSEARGETK
jgi:hypothetical protein